MWSNDMKCKYIFMFSLKNLARKGLTYWRLVAQFGVMELGQHWFIQRRACSALSHCLWASVDISLIKLSGTYLNDIYMMHVVWKIAAIMFRPRSVKVMEHPTNSIMFVFSGQVEPEWDAQSLRIPRWTHVIYMRVKSKIVNDQTKILVVMFNHNTTGRTTWKGSKWNINFHEMFHLLMVVGLNEF